MLLWLTFFVFQFQIISSWDTVNTASGLILRTFREKLCHRVIYEYFCMKKLKNVVEIVHNNVQKVLINSLHSNFWKKMCFFSPKNPYPALKSRHEQYVVFKRAWVCQKKVQCKKEETSEKERVPIPTSQFTILYVVTEWVQGEWVNANTR